MSATVTIDRALLRELVVEALTVQEIVDVFSGVGPTALVERLQALAFDVAVAADLIEADYVDGATGEPSPRWQAMDEEAEAAADAFLGRVAPQAVAS